MSRLVNRLREKNDVTVIVVTFNQPLSKTILTLSSILAQKNVGIPCSFICMLYSNEIIKIVFERGSFSITSTLMTADAYYYYSLGVFFLAEIAFITKVFYALEDMKTPVICAVIGIIMNIAGDFILIDEMGHNGLAFATSLPFYNESSAIPYFVKTVDAYIENLPFEIEIVLVNDGSQDDSVETFKNTPFYNAKFVKLLNFSRNYGAHLAMRAGILHASYDICCWICVDLQEPLTILPIAYEKICHGGYDVVYFNKETVDGSRSKRVFSKIYSYLMRKYAIQQYSSDGTANIAFNGKIKELLNKNVEANSSIMLQIMDMGFRYVSVPLHHAERTIGESKWTLSKKIKLFIDSFAAFSFMPIRLVSIFGIFMLLVGVLLGTFTVINKFSNPAVPVGYSTLISTIAMGFGVTNLSLGIIAEYLWRTYDAARGRPPFIISDIIELKSGSQKD